jgi:hypothetical protein
MAKSRARKPTASRYVTRVEFARVVQILDQRSAILAELQDSCTINFKRIAQMQVQLDKIERRLG